MPFSINFYQDQVLAGGVTSTPLGPLPRLLYVRDGEVALNGRDLRAGESAAASEGCEVAGSAEWSEIWRWEVDLPNSPPASIEGSGVLTIHRMSRLITTLDMARGSEWLFRLDQITSRAGHVSDPHTHPGPGIRCLLRGTFNIEQHGERYRGGVPGEPWWESGDDEVVFWGSETMEASFLRGMVLPTSHAGSATGTRRTDDPNRRRANWTLHTDELFTVPSEDR
ncbi:hypothetical protein [Candidatus Poriferisodalis sp.]|uniref:hypothetical protein n=1 Tax=Candidatus Poriferisodalis sp. TaxID=3101277 RepID=UPI003D0B997F